MRSSDELLLGESAIMDIVRLGIANAARTPAKVLLTGETGVGKEVVARLIHARGSRSQRPFVAVNCNGIPDTLLASELFGHVRGSFTGAYHDRMGLMQRADRGTLFLDELGEMSLAMQAMLLRFTETGEIQRVGADAPNARLDVRLLTATNRDLRAQIASGAFREDLFYRLNVIHIAIPPLRTRGTDVLLLLRHFLQQASIIHESPCPVVTHDAEQFLCRYSWPGNVRELRNVAERLTLRALARPVTPDDLPDEIRQEAAAVATIGAAVVDRSDYQVGVVVHQMWEKILSGDDFWTVAQQPFRRRQITKAELAGLIDRGLQETNGSYRGLVALFNLEPEDYKRFHAFLYQQNCNLPVGPYRRRAAARAPERPPLAPPRLRLPRGGDIAC